jgi:hypothetical protein
MTDAEIEASWANARARQAPITAMVKEILGDRVASGPFAGMRFLENAAWLDGNYGLKLIGGYESELHHAFVIAERRQPRTIINIGCAEGYYAVGLARLLPKARVIANDIDRRSLAACMANARVNGVEDRITPVHACYKPHQLDIGDHRRLYVVDIEGGELFLLRPALCPSLTRSDIIVECHDFFRDDISTTIARRFEDTHIVGVIGPKVPSFSMYPFLNGMPLGKRLMAVTEVRPIGTTWLVCWAK